ARNSPMSSDTSTFAIHLSLRFSNSHDCSRAISSRFDRIPCLYAFMRTRSRVSGVLGPRDFDPFLRQLSIFACEVMRVTSVDKEDLKPGDTPEAIKPTTRDFSKHGLFSRKRKRTPAYGADVNP